MIGIGVGGFSAFGKGPPSTIAGVGVNFGEADCAEPLLGCKPGKTWLLVDVANETGATEVCPALKVKTKGWVGSAFGSCSAEGDALRTLSNIGLGAMGLVASRLVVGWDAGSFGSKNAKGEDAGVDTTVLETPTPGSPVLVAPNIAELEVAVGVFLNVEKGLLPTGDVVLKVEGCEGCEYWVAAETDGGKKRVLVVEGVESFEKRLLEVVGGALIGKPKILVRGAGVKDRAPPWRTEGGEDEVN